MTRVGVVMWPERPWAEAGPLWRRAEELGFAHAWVYDHTAWRGDTPWYDGFSTLAAAAATTETIGLGTLVTSPNFRHPVPVAHAAQTIAEISGGRLTLGIGAGGASTTSDGGRLGGRPWTPRERAGRFEEWTTLLDRLLTGPETTYDGTYYSANAFQIAPRPRPPLAIAGNGPRGMRLAARLGSSWISNGDPYDKAAERIEALTAACEQEGRDPRTLGKLVLTGFSDEPWLESADAFDDLAGRYEGLGFTDVVIHWPRPGTAWDADLKVVEEIAARHR